MTLKVALLCVLLGIVITLGKLHFVDEDTDDVEADHQDVVGVPEQVHISYGVSIDQLWVTWLSFENSTKYTAKSTVVYGLDPVKLDQMQYGTATMFMNGNRTYFVHRVLLSKLKPDSTYHYRAGTEEHGWTEKFSFKTRPVDEENWSPRIAIYGDMGLYNGISVNYLRNQAAKGAYDAVFHVGDIAYNLDNENGRRGDKFFKIMEPVMATVPYQMAVGNHEMSNNFSQYVSRFTMINQATGELNNHFYSFNIGPMHVISFSSEFYYYTEFGFQQIHNQFQWLEADLREATKPENRRKHPWILAMGHRPMYCSTMDNDDCAMNESILRKGIPIVHQYGLEDLFYKYGVDIILGAHEHTYERLYPVYDRKVYNGSVEEPYRNPKAPIHLLVGSAGCQELIDPFDSQPNPWSAKRISDYGVTEFHVLNKTHIRVKQRATSHHGTGKVVDAVTFIKDIHGPEAWL